MFVLFAYIWPGYYNQVNNLLHSLFSNQNCDLLSGLNGTVIVGVKTCHPES